MKISEERFRLVFDFAPDAMFISDLKGTFIEGNKAAEKMLGYNKEELINSSCTEGTPLELFSTKYTLCFAEIP